MRVVCNIKRTLAVLTLALAAVSPFYAQQSPISFKTICTNLAKHPYIRGDFELNQYLHITKKSINSSGKFTLSSNDGIIWFAEKPIKTVSAVTKKFFIQEINGHLKKFDGEKIPVFTDVANVISAMFTGDFETLEKNFIIDYTAEAEGKTIIWRATLTPKDKTISKFLKAVEVGGTSTAANSTVEVFNIIQLNGDRSDYLLINQVLTDNLSEDECKYFEK
ncbi:hypothetical protein [Treponema sp.]|uniref:LolA family protein n=1 Tax=Treponema sp. TaxID=166 RepID=UPI00298E4336|nr:hypothetical protein [Treponema sp.]MCR5613030.1 hypothetical protein [Treponema sp.]